MAITFPRDVPDTLRPTALSFWLEPMIEITPLRSGRVISTDLGPSLWRAKWSCEVLEDAAFAAARAWYTTLMSTEDFYCYDVLREYPRAYPDGFAGLLVGGDPFDGTCVLIDVEADSVTVTLDSLPIGYVVSVDDYIAFDYGADGDSRALHKVVSSGTAGVGGWVTVEVRPPVRVGWDLPASDVRVVDLYRAAARMIIIPGSWSEDTRPGRLGSVSFEAIQTL